MNPDQWMKGWMDGWMIELLDGQAILFFVELLLHWATSLLRHLFSHLRLLWTATCLGHFWSEFVASATQLFSSRSYYNAFGNLQEPGARQHHWCFAARSRANAFCHNRLHTRIAGASHQIDQCSRSADNEDDVALLQTCQFFTNFATNRALTTVLCTFCRPDLPKVLRGCPRFNILKCKSSSATVLCTFCPQLSHIEARTRGNRDPTPVTPQATWPEKTQVSHSRVFSPVKSRVPELLLFSAASTKELLLALAQNVVDMMIWRQDSPWTFVRNSEVCSSLNFLLMILKQHVLES